MPVLRIRPVLYTGNKLQQLGELTIPRFGNFFEDFIVEPNIPKDCPFYPREISSGKPVTDEAFFQFLKRFGKYTLAVTPTFIYNEIDQFPFAGEAHDDRAYLQDSSVFFGYPDSDEYVRRMANAAIHEIGHFFGLDHHEKQEALSTGKMCAMVELGNMSGEVTFRSYPEFYDKREPGFCDPCREQLDAGIYQLRAEIA